MEQAPKLGKGALAPKLLVQKYLLTGIHTGNGDGAGTKAPFLYIILKKNLFLSSFIYI